MKLAHWKKSVLTACLLVGGLLSIAGSVVGGEAPLVARAVHCSRERVYVFVMNGMTYVPWLDGRMTPVGHALKRLGFPHIRTSNLFYRKEFQDEIRYIHQHDPQARIVLVGYSIGASVVHTITRTMEKEGIPVALLVYLDGHSFVHNFHHRPGNVERVVCIVSSAHILRGAEVHEADYLVEIGDSRHLTVPGKDATFQILLNELNAVAARP